MHAIDDGTTYFDLAITYRSKIFMKLLMSEVGVN